MVIRVLKKIGSFIEKRWLIFLAIIVAAMVITNAVIFILSGSKSFQIEYKASVNSAMTRGFVPCTQTIKGD